MCVTRVVALKHYFHASDAGCSIPKDRKVERCAQRRLDAVFFFKITRKGLTILLKIDTIFHQNISSFQFNNQEEP